MQKQVNIGGTWEDCEVLHVDKDFDMAFIKSKGNAFGSTPSSLLRDKPQPKRTLAEQELETKYKELQKQYKLLEASYVELCNLQIEAMAKKFTPKGMDFETLIDLGKDVDIASLLKRFIK